MSEAVVFYDADCGFCRWAVDKLLAWDRAGRLRPAALQGPEADRLLPGLSEEARMASWHLVVDGRSTRAAPPPRRSSGSSRAGGRFAPVVGRSPA